MRIEIRAPLPEDTNLVEAHEPLRTRLHIVITGHVDHGKSTIIGRLLADTGSLPNGKLEQVRAHCAATSRPFEYAFLLDALKDEQAQGITIDAARIFFNSKSRNYVILDAPGHIEFLKNMITGAAHAEAALLVIDAHEGIRENSRRHGYMLAMLGVRQVAVIVNKMDLVGFDEAVFQNIVSEFSEFLEPLDIEPSCFIPVSGRDGENIVSQSEKMTWYTGPTVLGALDGFKVESGAAERPFRMPVQGVYKFTEGGDDRRIISGSVLTGKISTGDEVLFLPSGKKSHVQSIERFNSPPQTSAKAGSATGFTLAEQIYVGRGEIAVLTKEQKPAVSTRMRVSLFWLGKDAMARGHEYTFKLGTARVPMKIESIQRVLNSSTLAADARAKQVRRNDVADCILQLGKAIAFDAAGDIPENGRFVIVDNFEIRGGGIIREALPDRQSTMRERVLLRNYHWEPSGVPAEIRAERFGQIPRLVLITGDETSSRKSVSRKLEQRLFAEGRAVYYLGIGNVLYGVDSDIGRGGEDQEEHMRRLAEIANLMLDAGTILIVSAVNLKPRDLEIISASLDRQRVTTVWMGDEVTTGLQADLRIRSGLNDFEAADQIKTLLQETGALFRPW